MNATLTFSKTRKPSYNCKKNALKIIVTLFCAITACLQLAAQSTGIPQKFNYSTQITDTTGVPVSNKQVSMLNTLTVGSPTGPVVYSETNTGITNAAGIITVVIGGGIANHGSVGQVPWTTAPVYFSTAMDVNGGTNYAPVGASQIVSYPYSLAAGNGVNTVGFDTTGKTLIKTADGITVVTSATGAWLTNGNSGLTGAGAYLGTNDSTDMVFKANGNESLRLKANQAITAAGNVGVGGVSPVTAMDVNGALALRSAAINASGATTLTVGNRSLFMMNVLAIHSTCTLTNGLVTGQLLMIIVSSTNTGWTVTLSSATNIQVPGPANSESLKDGEVVTFVWTGTVWLQTSLSNNN